ncbi:MAG TPA: NADP-dependent oxidoreductase [Kribbella sp.]
MTSGISVTSREWQLVARPHGAPRPGDFALREATSPALRDGQVLVRNLYLSVDPYMRRRMDDVPSYVPPFQLDQPMEGGAVGIVMESAADSLAVGDYVQHMLGWREYAVLDAENATPVDRALAPVSAYLGPLGVTGLTAYAGLLRTAALKSGDVVFVSGAAGAVGSQVGQLATLMGASRVIGSAGADDKVALLRAYGFSEAFNYRDAPVVDQLRRAAPEGIDVYFDNVGGEHLEAALDLLNPHGRVVLCGMIAQYNDVEPAVAPRNLILAINKRIRLQGLLARDHTDLRPQFLAEVGGWIRDGKLRYQETIADGIESAPQAFLDMLAGGNTGKMLVRLPA